MRLLLSTIVASLCVLASSGAPAVVLAQRRAPRVVSDVWRDPAPGIRYLRRTTSTPTQIHVVVCDLDARGVRLFATSHADRWTTVPEFATRHDLEIAVNGGFWSTLQDPRGLAAGGGELWPGVASDPEFATFALSDGRASIHTADLPPDPNDLTDAVSGKPLLVIDGEPDPALLELADGQLRAPRTAVGTARRGRQVILVVVDGRQRDSRGMSFRELAELFVELGADRALNLDGGGSSEMYVRSAGGVVNTPSRGRWEIAVDELLGSGESTRETTRGQEVFVRGREREVMNHLGIVAPRPDVVVTPHGSSIGGMVPIDAPAPLPPRVRVGPFRETLARIAAVTVPLLVLLVLVSVVRRLHRAWLDRRSRAASR
jgi:uncharacterized protein YigE (DUF2233 family)